MFNNTVNVVRGSTGQPTMFMGMDLTCDMGVAHALGEKPVVEKEIPHEKKVYRVSELLREVSKPSKPKIKKDPTCYDIQHYEEQLEKYADKFRLYSDSGKYNLILRMMMNDNIIKHTTKVKVGSNGRLREVYLVKEKQAYRIWGKTYYGLVQTS